MNAGPYRLAISMGILDGGVHADRQADLVRDGAVL